MTLIKIELKILNALGKLLIIVARILQRIVNFIMKRCMKRIEKKWHITDSGLRDLKID